MKPSEYQQRLLITQAGELLEVSRTSVDEIASSVGYDDVGGFRRVFRKIMGLTLRLPSTRIQTYSAKRLSHSSSKSTALPGCCLGMRSVRLRVPVVKRPIRGLLCVRGAQRLLRIKPGR